MNSRVFSALVIAAVALICEAAPVAAEQLFHAIKLGVLAHDVPDLWSGFQLEQDAADINIEAQFAAAWALPWGAIRPVIGGTINTRGDTSHAYIDARWEAEGPSNLFFAAGIGAAIHDGELDPVDPNAKALGSRVLFHIPFEVGLHLDAHNDLSVYFEHTSNANTQDDNEGLDRIGLRYGYRF